MPFLSLSSLTGLSLAPPSLSMRMTWEGWEIQLRGGGGLLLLFYQLLSGLNPECENNLCNLYSG